MPTEEECPPLEESYLESTFAGRYRKSAPAFISTPCNANGPFALHVFTPTPTNSFLKPSKTLWDRLSDVDEVSNENSKSASRSKGTCRVDQMSNRPNESTALSADNDWIELASNLPDMAIGNVVQLSNVKYSVQRCMDVGPFRGSYALYQLNKETFVYAKVVEPSSNEFLLFKRLRKSLRCDEEDQRFRANVFNLALNCYKFLDGHLLTFAENQATRRTVMGVVQQRLDADKLLFNDSANFFAEFSRCKNCDDYRRLPVALLKLSIFSQVDDVSSTHLTASENPYQANYVGMVRCVYKCVFGDDLKLLKRLWTKRIACDGQVPFHWNCTVWNSYFTSFLTPLPYGGSTAVISKFEQEFCNIVQDSHLEIDKIRAHGALDIHYRTGACELWKHLIFTNKGSNGHVANDPLSIPTGRCLLPELHCTLSRHWGRTTRQLLYRLAELRGNPPRGIKFDPTGLPPMLS
uniref:Uncharacterized protein n=1 Tax=Trichuris muris TaxID=70415 RepID=A0A5S6R517_TRIMR